MVGGDFHNGGGNAPMGKEAYEISLYLPLNFAVKILLKSIYTLLLFGGVV
jgi:hypothetical protein